MRLTALALLTLTITTGCGPTAGPAGAAAARRARVVGDGALPFVLLHGYSSSPDEFLPFTTTIRLPAGRRFVLPEGPGIGVNGRGRAWWGLDLASYLGSDGLPDLSRTRPAGLAEAAAHVRALLDEIDRHDGARPGDVILGGFSQGGMLGAEIAFRSDQPMQALVLLSPTIVDEASWMTGMRARAGLPVFLAHGRQDPILPFASSARLASRLTAAGLAVTWVPFDGGHDIPAEVVTALNAFLAATSTAPPPSPG